MTHETLRALLQELSSAPDGPRPVLSEEEVSTFEGKHGITLPGEYRAFLLEIGNGVTGRFGVFRLGCWHDQPLSAPELSRLGEEFDAEEAEACDDVEEVLAGLLPISDAGCSSCFSLVVSGDAVGQVWYDNRVDGSYLEPVVDGEGPVGFLAWYGAALTVANS